MSGIFGTTRSVMQFIVMVAIMIKLTVRARMVWWICWTLRHDDDSVLLNISGVKTITNNLAVLPGVEGLKGVKLNRTLILRMGSVTFYLWRCVKLVMTSVIILEVIRFLASLTVVT